MGFLKHIPQYIVRQSKIQSISQILLLFSIVITQKTTPPAKKMMKLVRVNGKTTESTNSKTLWSKMSKTIRKKIHRGTKANRRCQNSWRVQTTKMKRTTEPVPSTSMATETATATATAEVTVIPALEEGLQNGWTSLAWGRKRKHWALCKRTKHLRQNHRDKSKLGKSKSKLARKGKAA